MESMNVGDLHDYYKSICERERASQLRNQRLLYDLDKLDARLKIMDIRLSRIKDLRHRYMVHLQRRHPGLDIQKSLQSTNINNNDFDTSSKLEQMAKPTRSSSNILTRLSTLQYVDGPLGRNEELEKRFGPFQVRVDPVERSDWLIKDDIANIRSKLDELSEQLITKSTTILQAPASLSPHPLLQQQIAMDAFGRQVSIPAVQWQYQQQQPLMASQINAPQMLSSWPASAPVAVMPGQVVPEINRGQGNPVVQGPEALTETAQHADRSTKTPAATTFDMTRPDPLVVTTLPEITGIPFQANTPAPNFAATFQIQQAAASNQKETMFTTPTKDTRFNFPEPSSKPTQFLEHNEPPIAMQPNTAKPASAEQTAKQSSNTQQSSNVSTVADDVRPLHDPKVSAQAKEQVKLEAAERKQSSPSSDSDVETTMKPNLKKQESKGYLVLENSSDSDEVSARDPRVESSSFGSRFDTSLKATTGYAALLGAAKRSGSIGDALSSDGSSDLDDQISGKDAAAKSRIGAAGGKSGPTFNFGSSSAERFGGKDISDSRSPTTTFLETISRTQSKAKATAAAATSAGKPQSDDLLAKLFPSQFGAGATAGGGQKSMAIGAPASAGTTLASKILNIGKPTDYADVAVPQVQKKAAIQLDSDDDFFG